MMFVSVNSNTTGATSRVGTAYLCIAQFVFADLRLLVTNFISTIFWSKNPMALSCRPSGFYGPYSMDRNNYIEIHPTQAQGAKNSYHHPSKYLNQNVSPQLHYFLFRQSEIPLSSDDIIYYCQSRRTSGRNIYGTQRICLTRSGSAHFYVSWLSDFINNQKPLYKSLHQSFVYSFIAILPSESGVILHYSTSLPQILLFRHLTSIFESTHVISRY